MSQLAPPARRGFFFCPAATEPNALGRRFNTAAPPRGAAILPTPLSHLGSGETGSPARAGGAFLCPMRSYVASATNPRLSLP
jgi:hypothetical protein